MNGKHKAVSQLAISRAHIPSNYVVLCYCQCYNMFLFESLGLQAEDVAVLDTLDFFLPLNARYFQKVHLATGFY